MRKLFKHIGMICLALVVAIGSFFVPIRKPNRSQMASADSTSTLGTVFNSSDIFYCRLGNKSIGSVNASSLTTFSDLLSSSSGVTLLDAAYNQVRFNFRIELINSNGTSAIEPYFSMSLYGRANSYNGTAYSTDSSRGFVIVGETISYSLIGNSYNMISPCIYQANDSSYVLFGASVHRPTFDSLIDSNLDRTPTLNMVSIEIGNYSEFNLFSFNHDYVDSFDSRFSNSNIICYTDSHGWKYCFYIPNWGTDYVEGYLHYRKYYTDSYDFFSDNAIYNEGYMNGLADNQQNIYDNGYNIGYNEGKLVGKSEGIVEANDYSFISLFGALFDAPVTMLMGLLNFEFLGINLWAFVTSLFTLALVLFIVKLIMGR